MSDTFWVSRAMMDSTLMKAFETNLFLSNKELALEAMKQSRAGIPLPSSHFPSEIYSKYHDDYKKKQPNIFMAGGFWIISSDFANALQDFDLGNTSIYPTKIFQFDRKTPIEGEYFCLALGEVKSVFLPDQSPRVRKLYPDQEVWGLALAPKDGDLAAHKDVLKGVDLWVDTKIVRAFFLSDRLVKALRKKGLTRRLGLRRCRVCN